MSNNSPQHLKDIVESFDDAMLTTVATDGSLQSRPMRIAETTPGCDLWFVTSEDSGKTQQIEDAPQVNVSMQSSSRFVSLSGTAEVLNDRAKIAAMWNDAWKLWFPAGPEDPQVRLIHVDAKSGEFWDMSGVNGARYLLNATQAYFTGDEVEIAEGMNERVNL